MDVSLISLATQECGAKDFHADAVNNGDPANDMLAWHFDTEPNPNKLTDVCERWVGNFVQSDIASRGIKSRIIMGTLRRLLHGTQG
jgi:hypothetical protein